MQRSCTSTQKRNAGLQKYVDIPGEGRRLELLGMHPVTMGKIDIYLTC